MITPAVEAQNLLPTETSSLAKNVAPAIDKDGTPDESSAYSRREKIGYQ
jgi:hypothetical protein